jgi:hypothetical protein
MMRDWLTLLWQMPMEGMQTWEAVIDCANRLDGALVALNQVIDAAVQCDLKRVIRRAKDLGNSLHDAWEADQSYDGRSFGDEPVPGMDICRVLRSEADRVLNDSPLLEKWYALGVAVGGYRVLLGEWARHEPLDAGLPDIGEILRRAREACEADTLQIPAVHQLARMTARQRTARPRAVLRAVLGQAADARYPTLEDRYPVGRLMLQLHDLLQAQLARAVRRPTPSGEGQPTNDRAAVGPSRPQEGANRPKVMREAKQEERNKWIYDECFKGTPYKEIVAKLLPQQEWRKIRSIQGIRHAAKKYAERHGLSPIPSRQEA